MKDIHIDPVEQPRDGVYYFEFSNRYIGSSFTGTNVVFGTKEYFLSCNQNYHVYQGISFEMGGNTKPSIPKNTKYNRYQKITPGVFDDYYARNYWRLQRSFLEDAEYTLKVSDGWIAAFACKELEYLSVDVRYFDGNLWIDMSTSRKPQNYRYEVQRGKPIDESVFRQVFNLTLELLYDPEVAYREVGNFWEQLRMLCDGDEPIRGIMINADYYFNDLRRKITGRIRRLEKRLIDEDGLTDERAAIRGEIKGLHYALRAIDGAR